MCVATVRGALEPVPGVANVKIEQGKTDFQVSYDPAKVKLDDLLEKLRKAGEPAKKKGG